MAKPGPERRRLVRSAASLDERDETYTSLLGRLLAAIVAILLGAAMILAGVFALHPDTTWGLLILVGGVALILLAADQAWRVIRKLG